MFNSTTSRGPETHRRSGPRRRLLSGGLLAATTMAAAMLGPIGLAAPAQAAPVGQGFRVTPSDLSFILTQIKIAERHAATATPDNPCGTLLGDEPFQVASPLLSYGLRTVDGSCNNLIEGRETFGAAQVPFPRLTEPQFRDADDITPEFPVGPPGATSYAQLGNGNVVVDAEPRLISNLIVDQTSTNPAAVAVAGHPPRSQGAPGVQPCTTDPDPLAYPPVEGSPAGCVPSFQTLPIENITTDVGLSPPFNSLFAFFGQFFDHGIDQTVKGNGTVFVPLAADDPLVAGPDHRFGTADDLPAGLRFMVLTRALNQPGPDGQLGTADDVRDADNTDTPLVDLSQNYTSFPSHQVFLRGYVNNEAGRPVADGTLASNQLFPGAQPGQDLGEPTWASIKDQASRLLGIQLVDADATDVPMVATDPYGRFIPGPERGLPQFVTTTGLVEADRAADGGRGTLVPENVLHFNVPFLTDIANNADPSPKDTDRNPATPPVAPAPDADDVANHDFAAQPAGTYDDELLDAHFICGDGRCNENIALTTIHQVFHGEHNRLVEDIKRVLETEAPASLLEEYQLADGSGADGWNGERLFQAARFVTEMQYQHLVFEEFARKIQPAIKPFTVYHADVDPVIPAEFAHAVYRFGHSMLTDNVKRANDAGDVESLALLDGFLNPPALYAKQACSSVCTAPDMTPREAAGAIVMGASDEAGMEIDEFVVETLRSNLLGLPLDLPTLNMTRARDTGVPPLNGLRRQLHAQTNDPQLAPYTSWADFGQGLKHPESLVNFVAAYGTHPTIASQSTAAGRRAAAQLIVDPPLTADPDTIPGDAAEFMNGTGAWADAAGVTTTGLDSVDLWIGGLAEKTNVFGGHLGSTFNYVFETTLTQLQDGDRFYYLARTPGMNLRAQLEGNSFAELVMRNTDGTHTLKADAFATADCKFELANLDGTPAGYNAHGATVADDPASECEEDLLLLRKPDGTIEYRATNPVDPPGINGQSVFNGRDDATPDRVTGTNDNDTVWGNSADDVIQANGGDDVALGGAGDDRITDFSGFDVLKGGPGDDAIDGGPDGDLVFGGDGQDFTNGGANDNETFNGPGTDFVIAGEGTDAVFGGADDDWLQGGSGQDLLQGDDGAPFFDDPGQTAPGNEVMIGQNGEVDYDAEGGDDILAAHTAVERNAGAGGFDWGISQYDTNPANQDLAIDLLGLGLPPGVLRDRYQEVEALSGWNANDVLKGDDQQPVGVGGGGFTGCNALDQAGIDRIAGLGSIITPQMLIDQEANAAPGIICPLTGPVWGEGNILLGGAGSDSLRGGGGNDVLDGDAALQVRISVTDGQGNEIGSTDLMERPYRHTGPVRNAAGVLDMSNTTGATLQADVFAGVVDPGNLRIVREIVQPANGTSVDVASFSGNRAGYTVTTTPAGAALGSPGSVTTVTDNVGPDGTDTLRNVEVIRFADDVTPNAPTNVVVTASPGRANVSWTAPRLNAVPQAVTGYEVKTFNATTGAQVGGLVAVAGNVLTARVEVPAGNYLFQVRALNAAAVPVAGPYSVSSRTLRITAPTVPAAPVIGAATAVGNTATATWTAPANDGGRAITGYLVQPVNAAGTAVGAARPAPAAPTSLAITDLPVGSYRFRVQAVNAVGTGATSALSNAVSVVSAPTAAPGGVTATAGVNEATVSWTALPAAATGGSPVTGYSIRMTDAAGVQIGALRTATATATSLTVTALAATPVRFQVAAVNAIGTGPYSALTAAVTPLSVTAPLAPAAAPAVTRAAGSITATWAALPAGSDGGSAITGYAVRIVDPAGTQVGALRTTGAAVTTLTINGLTTGVAYRVQVAGVNVVGTGAFSPLSTAIVFATVPGAPVIGTATSGAAGGTITATAAWAPPASDGGDAITGYRVIAQPLSILGTPNGAAITSAVQPATARSLQMTLPANTLGLGAYRFQVEAINTLGTGARSTNSNTVTAR